jgi:hypothetical protein
VAKLSVMCVYGAVCFKFASAIRLGVGVLWVVKRNEWGAIVCSGQLRLKKVMYIGPR